MDIPATIEWVSTPDHVVVRVVDQTRLPGELVMLDCSTVAQLEEAIRTLRVRGAPALGCAGALGLALAAHLHRGTDPSDLLSALEEARARLAATRPTAVNLFWALERIMQVARQAADQGAQAVRDRVLAEAQRIVVEDRDCCRRLGAEGVSLLPVEGDILTHCNAGALATAGYGTALGVIRAAWERGHRLHVWVDETRPLLQGARLTAWELSTLGIPCTVICDNAAGALMAQGRVRCVVVGADRIAANGDVANKVGTYSLAVLARAHQVPFYVAAPLSTLDLQTPCGGRIPLEERAPEEVTHLAGRAAEPVTPRGVPAYNPAFDVTPADLVSAVITERGVAYPPLGPALAALARDS